MFTGIIAGIFIPADEFAMTTSLMGSEEAGKSAAQGTAGWRVLGRAAVLVAGVFLGQMVLYGPSLLGHKVLLPLDHLTQPGVYIPDSPETRKTVVHNFVLSDLVYIGEPGRRFLAGELRAGRWSIWNPYQFAGVPSLAPRVSPFYLLEISCASQVINDWVQVLVAEVAAAGF